MKTVIAGTRTFGDVALFNAALDDLGWEVTEVVSGGCEGPDLMGEFWAHQRKVPVRRFEADWRKHGRAAGPIRNGEMADYADVAVIFWDGKSRGSADMARKMQAKGKPVKVVRYGEVGP